MFGFRVIYLTLLGGFHRQNAAGRPGAGQLGSWDAGPNPEPEPRTRRRTGQLGSWAADNPNNCSYEGGPGELNHLVAAR